ncbi:MAG: FAD-dependent oxidoreductase [bacterium]|nr:FAD-dependent oxidoreductase [bacterium]
MRYVVVGAGAAGLTLAYYLCKAGLPVTVIEKEYSVGGLARSFHYGNWHFDIGPHRFYTANPQVKRFITEIQDTDFLEISRVSSVYYMGHYHDWPLRLSTIPKLPPMVSLKAGIDLFTKTFSKPKDSDCFKDYVLARYGKTLYQTFFKDYTEKFIGIPPEKTHRNWAKTGVERATIDNKVNTASLFELFKLMLIPKASDLNFWYPKFGGIQTFWNKVAEKIKKMGGEFILGSPATGVICQDNLVTGVVCQGHSIPCLALAWSGSITHLARCLRMPVPNLSYRSHVLFNIMLKKPPIHNFQWCYYGSKDLIFSRLSNPAAFSIETVPPKQGGICAEVSCQESDTIWQNPEKLSGRVIDDLLKVKAIGDRSDIAAIKVEKADNAYPIYTLDYAKQLDAIEKLFAFKTNLKLIGRTGKFWYNNMDHSIEDAFKGAASILAGIDNPTAKIASTMLELKS